MMNGKSQCNKIRLRFVFKERLVTEHITFLRKNGGGGVGLMLTSISQFKA